MGSDAKSTVSLKTVTRVITPTKKQTEEPSLTTNQGTSDNPNIINSTGQFSSVTITPIPKEITKECQPNQDFSQTKTSFKIYVYNLPAKFNTEVQQVISKKYGYCYDLDYCGTGSELFYLEANMGTTNKYVASKDYTQVVRNSQQFALEVLIHFKLLHSPIRTMNPIEADIFYIPAYTGLNCLTFRDNDNEFVNSLFEHLKTNVSGNYFSTKPHVMAVSKIEREQGSEKCSLLRHPNTKGITFIGIEREENQYWSAHYLKFGRVNVLAPYPSYIHYIPNPASGLFQELVNGIEQLNETKFYLDAPSLHKRPVLLFLAAGTRRSNGFRAIFLDQFALKTSKSYEDFAKEHANDTTQFPPQVMLKTQECVEGHTKTTIPWMRHSQFCLQPPGDSPTRKSFFDAILSGCIPILFTGFGKTVYPFEKYLDYSDFTYTVHESLFTKQNKTIIEVVKNIPKKTTQLLHRNVMKVAKWFQYSLPNGSQKIDDDAFTLIFDEIASNLHLPSIRKPRN
ncbi:hypothetical protein DPMN_118324 [Dreissena polymorpha]|uniref:Exostosin GT47 domain-containing protein n=2 Tax=Dreissena polymorpha TaxID=45954 RepID=A0A9D4JLK0_DREPO|nr:hypothetical protein DPMN_118324 [Dreissena polymorpha]